MAGDGSDARMRVVVVPLPAQGHLNQLLHFSRAIAQRGASISFVATSTHIHQVRQRVQGWDLHKFDIHFEELPMPHVTGEELDVQSTNTFPLHLIPLFEAVEDQLGFHVDQLLHTICSENSKRVLIVYDASMGWIQTLATKYSILAYIFRSTSAYYNLRRKQVRDETWDLPERLIKYSRRQRSLLGPAKGRDIS
ncbi:cis-zeatin O-glucosyltransferase 2-like [Cryptomeria japonica]|uniref:cis-zeatin O-glucosyltransferase 2-like n=1 Tax=Cryptomeria japonica TaxID=3369 RepID=UPI0027DA6E9D|nr:cis-zeatin O-glucosyltransferase 2-like [Cryptomeria japonica]